MVLLNAVEWYRQRADKSAFLTDCNFSQLLPLGVLQKRRAFLMDAAFHKLLASKQLEVHTKLDLIGARCHEVRPAESREEVIQRFLVRDIERGKPQRHLRM